MTPLEVADRVTQLLAEAEKGMGIVPRQDATDGERIAAIVATGEPVPSGLYKSVMQWRKGNGHA